MFVATAVLSVLLALTFLGAGSGKLAGAEKVTEARVRLGVDPGLWRIVGRLEVLGAVGLLIGLALPLLGAAAGIGLALVALGGAVTHVRAGEGGQAVPAVVIAALVIAAIVLRLATA